MSVASQSRRAESNRQFVNAELDLPGLGAALWRKKWRILVPTFLIALLTLVAVQLVTPRYLSEARVLIEGGRDNIFLRPDADKDPDRNVVDEQTVTSQVQLILSRDLARDVITRLKLAERPEFDPALNGTNPFKAVLGKLGLIKNPMTMTPEERVLDSYYDRLTVFAVEKSRVIVIDFLSEDPELAASVANAVADAYLVHQRAAKQQQAGAASAWLAGEINSMRKRVAEAEAKVESFRAKSNLLLGTNNTTLSAQQLGDFTTQLAVARAQKADAEAKAGLIRDMLKSGHPIESSDVLNSELIRRLSEQRVTLRAQLAEQSSSLLDGHPRIKELKAQIADLERQIRGEAETLARSLDNDAKIAGARLASQVTSLDQLKGQAATTNVQDVELRALERDAKSQRDLLESYLAKYREATSRDTINSSPADARVISRGTVSNVPAYPKKLPTLLIASLTTLVLCCGLVLTKALLAAPAGAFRPAERPALAEAGTERAAAVASSPRRVRGVPMSALEDVAANLGDAGDYVGRRIAVFGALPGLEASEVALQLARVLARDSRAVLVGLGGEDEAIRDASDDPSAGGLAELGDGTESFGDIITRDSSSSLHLVASGRAALDRAALLSLPGMATSFVALARSYDHVVFDAGAAEGPELEAIGEVAPLAVLVTASSTSGATWRARERLLDAGFDDVTVLVGGYPGNRAATAAAAAA